MMPTHGHDVESVRLAVKLAAFVGAQLVVAHAKPAIEGLADFRLRLEYRPSLDAAQAILQGSAESRLNRTTPA
ncbi:MAG TPA: hypothetical protein VEX68_03720 [Bryobacteraceae bacterium]|nr:hypothetical protein [Bryobacteraceae bacterium]